MVAAAAGLIGRIGLRAVGVGAVKLATGKVGRTFATEAFKYLTVLPVLGMAARAANLQIGYGGKQPAVPAQPNLPIPMGGGFVGGGFGRFGGGYGVAASPYQLPAITPADASQFKYLYGDNGWFDTGVFRKQGLYERLAEKGYNLDNTRLAKDYDLRLRGIGLQRELGQGQLKNQQYGLETQRQLGSQGLDVQRQLGMEGFSTQRYGFDTQKAINQQMQQTQRLGITEGNKTQRYGYDTQKAIAKDTNYTSRFNVADTNRATVKVADIAGQTSRFNTANTNQANVRIADIAGQTSRFNTANSNQTAVRIADIAGQTSRFNTANSNQTAVRIADIQGKTSRYQADRGVEAALFGGNRQNVMNFAALLRAS